MHWNLDSGIDARNSHRTMGWSHMETLATFISEMVIFYLEGIYFSFIVSPDESWGYLGFSTVTLPPPPPQRFPFGRDNLKNILVITFKFDMWVKVYGNATNAIVL